MASLLAVTLPSIALTAIGWGLPHRPLAHCLDSNAMVQAKGIADLQEANQERQLTLSGEAGRATRGGTNVVLAQGSNMIFNWAIQVVSNHISGPSSLPRPPVASVDEPL